MARRIATEYKLMELDVNYQQLQEFMKLFEKSDFRTEVRVFENGDTEFVLFDEETEIPLTFRNMGTYYKFEGSYMVKSWNLAHALQKAIREYKGHAFVHRIYEQHTVAYHYKHGNVMLIKELKGDVQRVVYEYTDLVGKLNRLFNESVIEDKIEWIKLQIDQLLEQRLKSENTSFKQIDNQLRDLVNDLFILEA